MCFNVVSLYQQINRNMTLSEIIQKTEENIEAVKNGITSRYFSFSHPETGEDWTIRVSNHNANPSRFDDNTISFVVFIPEIEDDEDSYNTMCVNKKNFRSLTNQFALNENGDFEEQFRDVAECLEYVLF
jgi:hypothetical protein